MFKDKNEVEKLTIVMCGDKQVGKMTLANIFTEKKKEKGEKIEKFMPLKSFKNNAIVCHNETISVDIIALSGDKRYRNVNNHYYHKANAVIFVYDVSNEQSFHELENFYRDFQKHVANRPVILVGNKIDLERRVKTDDALSWARKNNMHFMEVSNETPSRVKTLFNRVAYEAYSAYLESEGRLPLEKRVWSKEEKKNDEKEE